MRGWTGKTKVHVALAERRDEPAKLLGLGVRRAVQRQRGIRRLDGDRRAGAIGRKSARRVGHDVADHFDAAGDALGRELLGRPLVGTEEKRRELVDLDPVALLGHREVEAAQARLDVRDRNVAGRLARPASVEFVSP